MQIQDVYKVSAQDATTVTLVPQTGEKATTDLADVITNIVITFTNARDSVVFDVTNREFEVIIRRR